MTLREFLDYVMDEEIIEVKMGMYGGEFSTAGSAEEIRHLDPDVLEKNVIMIENGINLIVVTVR